MLLESKDILPPTVVCRLETRMKIDTDTNRPADDTPSFRESEGTQESLDIKYMKEALKMAKKAGKLMEVPIGCVIVYDDRIIGRGYNRRNTDKTTLGHAEITAIKKASKVIGDWRLEDCTIYITLEPCQMCAGAIVQARIPRVVIGSMNPKAGCGGSILNILEMPQFNHVCQVTRGVLDSECSSLLSTFFKNLRESKKTQTRAD